MPAASAPPFPPWADLDASIVSVIAARCALSEYATCRAVCGAWRSALPSLLSSPLAMLPADDDDAMLLAACFHHARRWARLLHDDLDYQPTGITAAGCRCVGASRDGWLALVDDDELIRGRAPRPAAGGSVGAVVRALWRWVARSSRRRRTAVMSRSGSSVKEQYGHEEYAQNFDEGGAAREPENLSRSFSARYARQAPWDVGARRRG